MQVMKFYNKVGPFPKKKEEEFETFCRESKNINILILIQNFIVYS
jgi:hypothetical protein